MNSVRRVCRRYLRSKRQWRCLSSKTVAPDQADVVVIGGGIIGTSVAYHLSQEFGMENVLLLERDRLTSGTTWHAAGLMNSFGSLSSTSTWMRQYTQHLYKTVLPEQTGMSTGFQEIGFIELACDTDRLEYYQRIAAFNRHCGVNVSEIGPDQVKKLFPVCKVDDVLAGFYVSSDGRANPTDTTMALAKAARNAGVTILEHTPVSRVTSQRDVCGRRVVSGVELANGQTIATEKVVNCAGMWARQLAQDSGVVRVPNQAAEHYYIITEPIEGIDRNWPVIEDSSKCAYIRPESGGLMIGLFEWEGAPWNVGRIPQDFSFGSMDPDYDRIGVYVERALERVPIAKDAGIKSFFCGPESFTPDSNPIVGESSELKNYFIGAGLNSLGILTGGGVGYILASWVKNGHAPDGIDVTCINANRFEANQSNASYRESRVCETLGETYKVHYPDHQLKTCRNVQKSVLHDQLANEGACFRDVSGWEAPAWFGSADKTTRETFGRPDWFQNWQMEHNSCRENVALFDMSFMSKFLVQGRDAGAFLNRLSTANVDADEERITYTQWLNERGFMEADLTVMKLEVDQFLVVATDTMRGHVLHHMMRHLEPNEFVTFTDVTGAYSMISIQGPKSRELLQKLTCEDMAQFPFRKAKTIDLILARAICARITYVGELGYELYIPTEQARYVYDQIKSIGGVYGLHNAGLKALGSLRLEKGYRDYGHDIDNTDSLLETGLSFTCDFKKSRPFIGQDSVLAQKESTRTSGGLQKRMVNVLLSDSNPFLHHGEVVWHGGKSVADIRVGSYGHSLKGAVGLAMLELEEPITKQLLNDGNWEVEIGKDRYPCKLSLSPFFDPKSLRVKV